jgi:FAD-dependent urate hydroxylase
LAIAVVSVAQADGKVLVGFSDGSSGDYDLVVGADGIHSTVSAVTMRAGSPVYANRWCGGVFRRSARKGSPI